MSKQASAVWRCIRTAHSQEHFEELNAEGSGQHPPIEWHRGMGQMTSELQTYSNSSQDGRRGQPLKSPPGKACLKKASRKTLGCYIVYSPLIYPTSSEWPPLSSELGKPDERTWDLQSHLDLAMPTRSAARSAPLEPGDILTLISWVRVFL